MSYRSGMTIGQGLASIGFGLASTFRQQEQELIKAEEHKWKQEDRTRDQAAEEVAASLAKDPKADLSKYDAVTKFKGAGIFADHQQKQYRASKEGMAFEREKAAMSVQRINDLGTQYEAARAQKDDAAAEHIVFKLMAHHARNGILSVDDAGDGKNIKLELLDGTTRTMPKPSLDVMDKMVKAYLFNPSTHNTQRLAEQEFIREHNYKVSQSPEEWTNKNGQRIVVTKGYIDPETRKRRTEYVDEDLQPLTEEQAKDGGFKPAQMWEDRAKVAKAKLGGDLATMQRGVLDQPDPRTVFQNQAGGVSGRTIGGGVVTGKQIPQTAIPAEESQYNQVTTEQGDYGFIKKPGKTAKELFVDTGVKAPQKDVSADNTKISVKDAGTGKERQMTIGQVRKNLEQAKDILKAAKDDKGNMFILPSVEQFKDASEGEKEIILAKIERLARDTKQSPAVRTASKQALNYLEALGITQGEGQETPAKFDFKKWLPKNTPTQPAVMP